MTARARRWGRLRRAALPALVALAAALAAWLPVAGRLLVVADPLAPADAIVALAGSDTRAWHAAELQRAGYARWTVASDLKLVGPLGRLGSEKNRDIAFAAGGIPWHVYETDRIVGSTYTELVAIRDLAALQGWGSLIVVTSPEHTRRTRMMAAEVFRGSGIAVRVRPVVGHGYDPAAWWRDGDERLLTLTEYPKLIVYLLGYRG